MMKNRISFMLFFLLLSNTAFSQSMKIDKTDQTTVTFELTEIDSITFSTISLAKYSDTLMTDKFIIDGSGNTRADSSGNMEESMNDLNMNRDKIPAAYPVYFSDSAVLSETQSNSGYNTNVQMRVP